ncbi:hypothetical protein [Coleofasciculus sp. FACHB-SPT36]|uniref:hypothetical protein n=1 Tax=Cyanophyceae TaxID=3028117 RepID=UPI001F54EA8F|nr:hypothetical protein [Coleofasciculus sp. FACHB-SPT36]
MFKINIQEIEAVSSRFQETASEIVSNTQGAVSEAISTTQEATDSAIQEVSNSVTSIASTFQKTASEIVTNTQNAVSEAISTTQEAASNLIIEAQQTSSAVTGAATIAAQEAFKVAHNIKFENLPHNLQLKFHRAGVREGIRNVQEAAKVYETIPAQIRAQGYEAIREFCSDKDWSHIKAHVNGGGKEASNGIFENFRINRSRGGVDMTPEELAAARKVLGDAAFKASVEQVIGAVVQGALVAAVIELVFSTLENSLSFAEGKITQDELIRNVAVATAKAGLAGGVVTAILMVICMIFPPIAALLGYAAIPLAVIGIGFMCVRAWEIFIRADKLFGITEELEKFIQNIEQSVLNFDAM